MSDNFIFVPPHLEKKLIPTNNVNPLYELSYNYNIKHFKDINKDLLKKVYKNNRVKFFKLIEQLTFFGVRFNDELKKYNMIPKDESKIFKNKNNGFLCYDNIDDKNLIKSMRKYGLIKKQDINGLYLKSVKLKAEKSINLQEFIEDNFLEIVNIEDLAEFNIKYKNNSINGLNYIKEKSILDIDTFDENLFKYLFIFKNNCSLNSLSEKEILILINRFLDYYDGKLSILQLTGFLKIYSKFLGIENIKDLNTNNIKKLVNMSKSLKWGDDYFNILKILKENNIKVNCDNLLELLDFSNKISLYFYLNKLKQNKRFSTRIDTLNFEYDYIHKLLKLLSDKDIKSLIRNYILNESRPIDVKELKNSLSLIRNIEEEEITDTLKKSDEFVLVGLEKWNLKELSDIKIKGSLLDDLDAILFDSKFSKRDIKIFKSRVVKMQILEEVGDNVGLTRERVRQIVGKIIRSVQHPTNIKFIKPYFNFIDEILDKEVLISKERLNNIKYFRDLNSDQVINLYNEINNGNLIEIIEGYLIKESNKNQMKIDCILKEIPNIVEIKDLEFIFKYKGIVIRQKKMLRLLLDFDYIYKYNNYILIAPNKSDMVEIVIKLFFIDKISFNSDFNKLKKLLNDVFNNKFKNDSKRSIRGLIQRENSNMIIWGRGEYIHIDNICIEKNSLVKYIKIINSKLNNLPEINIDKIYNEYKKQINKLGIPNKWAFYFLLKYHFSDKLYFYRFPRIFDVKYKGKEIPDNYKLIKNYIKNKNRAVKREELVHYFVDKIGWEEYALYNKLAMNDDVFHIGNEEYIHIEHLNFDKKELKEIVEWVEKTLDSEFPEIKVDNIFEENIVKMKKANISNKHILLNLLKYYYNDKLDFRGFHISKIGVDNTIVDRITDFIKSYEGNVFKEEILEEFNNYLLTNKQIYHILYKNENIIKLNTNEYIHIDNLKIDNEEIKRLIEITEEAIDSSIYNFASITYDILPEIKKEENKWTKDLIVDLLKRKNEYHFLGNNLNKYVVVKKNNELDIKDNISFLGYLLSEKYNGYVKKSKLKKYLLKIGFTSHGLPVEYKENCSKYPYYIENNEIILKKFDY